MSSGRRIVVVGAGVTGLTTTLQLLRAGYRNITVIAKHLPSKNDDDYAGAAEYASPWAGANWSPISKEGTPAERWDRETYNELKGLAVETPQSGVWLQNKTTYYRNIDTRKDQLRQWYKDLVDNWRFLPESEVPPFADYAVSFKTISLAPNVYLNFLVSRCISLGAKFEEQTIDHVKEAFHFHSSRVKAAVVINCTGLGSRKLGGVKDSLLRPVRGQLVVVENKSGGMYGLSGTGDLDESIGECCYVINRPGDNGTVLGGCYFESWTTEPDFELAERIMKRSIMVCPQLVPPGTGIEAPKVTRYQVGFRPYRERGPRIEREDIADNELGNLTVVHSYGAGSFGYQASYGMANEVVRIVQGIFGERSRHEKL